MILGIVASEL